MAILSKLNVIQFTVMSNKENSKLERAGLWLGETLFPHNKFDVIKNAIMQNRSLSESELFDKLYEEGANNEDFEGILELNSKTTPSGRKVYIVKLASQYYPPNIASYDGMCFPTEDSNTDIIFINGNLSPDAEKALIDHEMFHARGGNKENPYLLEEAITILNTSILKNRKESLALILNSIKTTPEFILRYITHVRKRIKDVISPS